VSSLKTVKFLSLKPQHDLIRHEVEQVWNDSFESSQYILGPGLSEFEANFAKYSDTGFCLGVASGLDALTIALKAIQLEPSDEIIVPANTYFATWLAVSNVGAKIVPVEPDESTYNLNPVNVSNALTKRTRAILPVHLYGQPCEMTALQKIALDNQIQIVEDNAQAQGANWNGKKTGAWGNINATSFYPTKNLGALGDGGAITTSDPELASFVRTFRNYGSGAKNYFEMLGVNSRLDEVQARILSVKLKNLDGWNLERRSIAEKYNERLAGLPDVQTPFVKKEAFHVYHLYVVRAKHRDELKMYLAKNGIETMIHYPVPPYAQQAYADLGLKKESFPITQNLADSILSLPLWPGISDDDIDYVATMIKRFYS
jgi:dTDP-4-amino-4,6-dideoxygalactose transaminase